MTAARTGVPIAAHLALLVVVSLLAAFAITVSVVVMLPRRPPDVARSDQVLDAFFAGYEAAKAGAAPHSTEGLRWRIETAPPHAGPSPPPMRFMQRLIAQRLAIEPNEVFVRARPHAGNVVFRFARENDRPRGPPIVETWSVPMPVQTPMKALPPDISPLPLNPEAPPFGGGAMRPPPDGVVLLSGFEFAARLPEGTWAVMRQSRTAEDLDWIMRAALAIGATLTIVLALTLFVANGLARRIQRFAHAAQTIGADLDHEAAPEDGPRELRVAARAVNAMRARLRKLIGDRTETLAAVAHDMRTPLMRLTLAAEGAPDDIRAKMRKEVAEIEALVASFIAFAREDPAQEPRVRLDLTALIAAQIDDRAAEGQPATFADAPRVVVTGQPLGLKRMIGNLIDNAVKHGGRADVSLRVADGVVVIDIDDDGPGVPPDRREDVFKPFIRLNESATRGAGLGLPAARSIAYAHGGDIAIVDRESGARVRVTLPLD